MRDAHVLRTIGVLTLFLMASNRAISQTIPDDAQLIAALRSAIQYETEAKRVPAFSIALVDGDRVVWADGFGFQDAAKQTPATAETVYRVGSVSKLFTDIAVMRMVEQGRLDLDAPVSAYLPGFQPRNPFDRPITLRQLMSHRSGLVRESPVGHYFDATSPTLADTIASLNQTTLVYPPETRVKYSNAGVAVVGAVLEQVSGRPFAPYLRDTLLRPLGMATSDFELTPEVESRLAHAQMWTYDGRRFPAPKFALGTAPAGNLYASVLDLSKFIICLHHDGKFGDFELLKPETLRAMTTPVKDANGKPLGFGLGFHVQELDGHKKIGHGGAVYGFSTQVEVLPEKKLGVAAVSALDGSNGVVGRLADYALRLMLARQAGQPAPTYRRTEAIPADRARALVGKYQSGDDVMRITELDGRVYLEGGEFRQELRAAADNGALVIDDVIDFGRDVTLAADHTLRVGEREYQRIADELPADIPAAWRGLIGEYGLDHNVLYILEDGGRLWALIEWFYYYPLTEINENTFAFPDYGLYHGEKLRFTRDDSGRATQVVAAEVLFPRRDVGTRDGSTFQIQPLKPINELRAAALAASPPEEPGEFRASDLVELIALDPSIKLDIRYATTNNFTGAVFYQQSKAFLQRPAAEAVVRAHQRLRERGLGLLIHDAYRPWHVTKMFWDATPDQFKDFVANPALGSRHNRGCAVDLTLCELATGEPIPMVGGYDEFSPRSYPDYPGGTSRQRYYRDLLRAALEAEGFRVFELEWWHFDFQDWKQYRIGNATFEQLEQAANAK